MKLSKSQREFLITLVALFAVGVIFSIISMAIQTTYPRFGSDGQRITQRTTIASDGTKVNFEANSHGWPVPYYETGCFGTGEACQQYAHWDWKLTTFNILAWFGLAAVIWTGYYTSFRPKSRRR